MTFLMAHWHWIAGGLGLLVLVGVVLSPVAALKLAKSIGESVLDAVRYAIEWSRKPHDWWRITCLWLAVAFTAAAFVAWDARQTIVVVQQECNTRVAEVQQACSVVEWNAQQIVKRVNEETARQVAQAERDAADARAARQAADAEATRLKGEAASFDKRMEQARRNPDCNVLLETDVGAKCGL